MKTARHPMFTTWVCLLILFVVTVAIFGITVEIRRPSFGKLDTMEASQFTPHVLLMLKQVWVEGLLHSRGIAYEKPASIELEAPHSREEYLSYPPGFLLPPHFVFLLLGTRPSLPLVMAFNMAYHFLIALTLGVLIFVFLLQLRYAPAEALILALVPVVAELLLPAPIYLHLVYFFADSEVIIFFVFYIFLEVLRDGTNNQRGRAALAFVQALTALMGMLTDWFFGPIAFCVYIKRVLRGEMGKRLASFPIARSSLVISFVGRSMAFWFPLCLALLLFAWQIYFMNGFGFLSGKLQSWSGMSKGSFLSLAPLGMWLGIMFRGYGVLGILLTLVYSLCFVVVLGYTANRVRRGLPVDERASKTLALIFMFAAPCFLYLFLLKNHGSHPWHYFAALKFAVPIATVPFVLMPILVLSCWGRDLRFIPTAHPSHALLAPLAMLLLAVSYVLLESPKIAPQFIKTEDYSAMPAAEFVEANTRYEDIVFIWDNEFYAITERRFRAFTMKECYMTTGVVLIQRVVQGVKGEYVVCILSREGKTPDPSSDLNKVIALAYESVVANGFRLDRIRKKDFLALAGELQPAPPTQPPPNTTRP